MTSGRTDARPPGGELIAALLARCDFPPAGTAVTCAVSGGADSLALLVLAAEAGCRATAVHVDHGLRPGSDEEAEVVRAAADRWGAAFRGVRVAVAPGPNLEARARATRYAALPADVLTGHTADDQAETMLLNLLRGAGLDGLAGMDPRRRPLRRLRRRETRALCDILGLEPIEDPTNLDSAFRRTRVRHELLPLLDDIAERDVAPILAPADRPGARRRGAPRRAGRRARPLRRPGARCGPGAAGPPRRPALVAHRRSRRRRTASTRRRQRRSRPRRRARRGGGVRASGGVAGSPVSGTPAARPAQIAH